MERDVVMTVLGPVRPNELGITLTHEHCLIDGRHWFQQSEELSRRRDIDRPIDMSMLGELRRRQMNVTRDNLILADEDVTIAELQHYFRAGGNSLVDATCIGMGRDPLALQRISRASGLHIVMGTGFYVERAHPSYVKERSIDDLAEIMINDIVIGVGWNEVRCGVIGEIGVTGIPKGEGRAKVGPITPEEEKVLRAAARAAKTTGAPVLVHLDPLPPLGSQVAIDVLEDEGLPPERMIIGHMDQVHDLNYTMAAIERGVFVEYDAWGREYYREEWGWNFVMGQDAWRVEFTKQLIESGYSDRLLFAQDVCFKTDLRAYGGWGYAHILNHIVPMLLDAGVPRAAIMRILKDNPARALTLQPVQSGSATKLVSAAGE
jgi:phosphotriesterase-related protein